MTCEIDFTTKFTNARESVTFLFDWLHNTLRLPVTDGCEEGSSLESEAILEGRGSSSIPIAQDDAPAPTH